MNTTTVPRSLSVGWRTVAAASLLALLTPLLWPGLLTHLFDSGYMSHGHCYLWKPSLVALHLVSDLMIGAAYVTISASLAYVVHRVRREIPFHWIILAFGVFIVACGATHLMEVWTIWHATYWLAGAVKLITAIASTITAFAMPFVVPAIFKVVHDAKLSRDRQENLATAYTELDDAYRKLRDAEGDLRREHRYMSAMVEGLREQVIVCDTTGAIVFANRPRFATKTGSVSYATAIEAIGDLELLHPHSGRPLGLDERPILRALRGETVQEMPVEVRAPGGHNIALASAKPILDVDETMIGAMAVLLDVTEERRTARAIHDLQRNTETILQAAGEGICGIDANGHTTLMNPAAEAISGWRYEEVEGKLRHDLIHHTRADGRPYPWTECPVYMTLQDGELRNVRDDVHWRPDGTWFPVEYVVNPIYEEEKITGAVITFQDITQRKRLEQDLEQSRRVESLGRLAATIAHEFNNVLMGIQPFIEIIAARASDDSDIRKSLNYISAGVQRGKKVSHEILRFTQPAEPLLEKIDVHTWASQLIDQARPMISSRVKLDVDISMDVEGMLADASQLHQVFVNLFLNARDAMPDGGTIRLSATCSGPKTSFSFGAVPSPEQFVHFTVSDTGSGIPPEVMTHLFEPLFTTKKVSGTGLGLALVRQVVTRHGGHVFVESKYGSGAAFHIFIRSSDAPPVALDAEKKHGSLRGMRVLLVEDERAVSAGIEILMEIEGIDVKIISRGAEAVAAIEQFTPDVVVLDVGLPDIPGNEVYPRIAERWPNLPVVFSTGHADPSKLSEFLARPNVAFLTKPYQAGDLLLLIEKLANDHGSSPV